MNGEYLDKWTNHDEEDENKPREKEQKDILVSRDSLLLLICVHNNVNWFQAAQKPKSLLLLLLICCDFRSHRFESRDYSFGYIKMRITLSTGILHSCVVSYTFLL